MARNHTIIYQTKPKYTSLYHIDDGSSPKNALNEGDHFPIQKLEKIDSSKSSVEISPVINPR